jgi:hypothetical protein
VTTFRVGDRVNYRGYEGEVTDVASSSGYVAVRVGGRLYDFATFHVSCSPGLLVLLSRPSASVPEEARPLSTGAMGGGQTR